MVKRLRSHGVTLIELLVVVAILGVVAVAATPFLSAVDPHSLDLAASEYASAMRFARSEALRTGKPYGFEINPAQQRIRVFRADTGTTPPTPVYDVAHPFSRNLYDIRLGSGVYAPMDNVSAAPVYQGSCTDTTLTLFNARGTAYCRDPDSVLLRQMAVVLTLGSLQQTLLLEGISGRVTVQ